MRVLKWFVLTLVIVLAAGSLSAQTSDWSAYLYNSVMRQLLRVDLNGTQTPINLNLSEGSYLGEYETAFTSDGNYMAYCTIDYTAVTAGSTLTPTLLTVYDLTTGTVLYQQDLGPSIGCWINYSGDNSMLAVGMVNFFPGDPSADTSRPIWELRIVDADSGIEMASMSPLNAEATDLGLYNDFSIMPDVRYFDNNQLIFTGILWGTEGAPVEPAFLWDLNSSDLQAFDDWWHWGLAINGREVVWLESDSTLPIGNPGGPVPASNVVRSRDTAGEVVTIYHSPDWILLDTEFIDNGRRLAMSLLEPFDPNSTEGSEVRWVALDRAGNVSDLASTTGFSQIGNAPEGYVYLSANSPNVGATMTLDYHTGDQTRTLFTGASDDSGGAWTMIWTTPVQPADDLPPFIVR